MMLLPLTIAFALVGGHPQLANNAIAIKGCAGLNAESLFEMRLPYLGRTVDKYPCPWYWLDDVRLKFGYYDGPNGEFRFVEAKANDAGKVIIVFLVGGPRASVLSTKPEVERSLYEIAYARNFSAKVVIPEYLGTGLRSLYPRSDILPAAKEVGSLISALKLSYPDHRIMLVTHSAGAYVGLAVLRQQRVETVLISPPIDSMRDMMLHLDEHGFPGVSPKQMKQFGVLKDGRPIATEATEEQQAQAFAGAVFGQTLADQLRSLPPRRLSCLKIVVGSQDPNIGVAGFNSLRREFPAVHTQWVNGLAHVPVGSQAVNIAAATLTQHLCR